MEGFWRRTDLRVSLVSSDWNGGNGFRGTLWSGNDECFSGQRIISVDIKEELQGKEK